MERKGIGPLLMGQRPSGWRLALEGLITQQNQMAWSVDPALIDGLTPAQADAISASLRRFLMAIITRTGRT